MNKLKLFFTIFFSIDAVSVIMFLTLLFLSWAKIIVLGQIHLIIFLILAIANLAVLTFSTTILILNKRLKR